MVGALCATALPDDTGAFAEPPLLWATTERGMPRAAMTRKIRDVFISLLKVGILRGTTNSALQDNNFSILFKVRISKIRSRHRKR
jgi:hypothetical protein